MFGRGREMAAKSLISLRRGRCVEVASMFDQGQKMTAKSLIFLASRLRRCCVEVGPPPKGGGGGLGPTPAPGMGGGARSWFFTLLRKTALGNFR